MHQLALLSRVQLVAFLFLCMEFMMAMSPMVDAARRILGPRYVRFFLWAFYVIMFLVFRWYLSVDTSRMVYVTMMVFYSLWTNGRTWKARIVGARILSLAFFMVIEGWTLAVLCNTSSMSMNRCF